VLRALPEGGGANVVNVLLVDFRGFDTLGEITVLGAVALTVYALLRRFRPAPESMQMPVQQASDRPAVRSARPAPRQDTADGYLMVQAVYMRFLLPVMGVIAVYFFMRGHNLPGGGFVAGLIFATALIAAVHGGRHRLGRSPPAPAAAPLDRVRPGDALRHRPGRLAARLSLPDQPHRPPALAAARRGPRAERLLLRHRRVPVVVGATMLILVALAHQSLRSHRMPAGRAAPAASRRHPPAKEIH
jgi:multicomponent K+:H+ antiporter subunit A